MFPVTFLNKMGMTDTLAAFQAAKETAEKIDAFQQVNSQETQQKFFFDEAWKQISDFFQAEVTGCRLKLENFNEAPTIIDLTQLFYKHAAPFQQNISYDDLLSNVQIPFKRSPDFMSYTNRVRISTVEGYLLSRLEQPHTLGQILSMVPGDEQSTRKALLALWAFGLVDSQVLDQLVPKVEAAKIETPKIETPHADTPKTVTPSAKEKSKPRPEPAEKSVRGESIAELRYLIENAYYGLNRQDYYTVLGITTRASLEEIKIAYYGLARKFHPDRFYGMENQALKEKVDVIFATINGAYETLKSAKKRSEYDSAPTEQRTISTGLLSSESKGSAAPLTRDTQLKMAEEHAKKAQAAYDKGNNYEAVQYLKSATQIAPEVAKYWQLLGISLSRNPQWRKEAEDSFNKAAELEPKNPENHLYMGFLYKNAGLKLRARKHFVSCLQLDPKNEIALRELAAIDSGESEAEAPEAKKGILRGIFKQKK